MNDIENERIRVSKMSFCFVEKSVQRFVESCHEGWICTNCRFTTKHLEDLE